MAERGKERDLGVVGACVSQESLILMSSLLKELEVGQQKNSEDET